MLNQQMLNCYESFDQICICMRKENVTKSMHCSSNLIYGIIGTRRVGDIPDWCAFSLDGDTAAGV